MIRIKKTCSGLEASCWMLSLWVLFCLAGCSESDPELRHKTRDMYELSSSSPPVFLRAHPFEGELVKPEKLLLGKPSILEFLPMADGKERPGAVLEVFIKADGRVDLLHSSVPAFLRSHDLAGEKSLGVLGKTLRVDLSPYTGKTIALKWVLRQGDEPLSGAVGSLKIFPKKETSGKQPHILFICSDTHRYDYALGKEGRQLMPALQRLKKSAVTYHRAFSNASWTMPSIVSALTGLFPRYHRTGIRTGTVRKEDYDEEAVPPGRFVFMTGNQFPILTVYPERLETLTELLRARGYTTAMVVSNPLYLLSGLFADGQDVVVKTGVAPGEEVNQSASRMLRNLRKDSPVFLLVHYMDVHQWEPWYFKEQHPDLIPREHKDKVAPAYAQAVRDTDTHMEQLLKMWDEAVGLDESLVVFYSDHGEHLLSPGCSILGHGNSMGEELLHVPFLVHYPRSMQLSGERDDWVSLIDLPPTILDLLGDRLEETPFQGRSLLSIEEPEKSPRLLFADSQLYGNEMSSVREGPYKLVIDFGRKTGTLFDIRLPYTPLGEDGQVAMDEEVRGKLKAAFEAYALTAQEKTKNLASDQKVNQKEARKDLEALGYVR